MRVADTLNVNVLSESKYSLDTYACGLLGEAQLRIVGNKENISCFRFVHW